MPKHKVPTIVNPQVLVEGAGDSWQIILRFGVEDHRQFVNNADYNERSQALRVARRIADRLKVEVTE